MFFGLFFCLFVFFLGGGRRCANAITLEALFVGRLVRRSVTLERKSQKMFEMKINLVYHFTQFWSDRTWDRSHSAWDSDRDRARERAGDRARKK